MCILRCGHYSFPDRNFFFFFALLAPRGNNMPQKLGFFVPFLRELAGVLLAQAFVLQISQTPWQVPLSNLQPSCACYPQYSTSLIIFQSTPQRAIGPLSDAANHPHGGRMSTRAFTSSYYSTSCYAAGICCNPYRTHPSSKLPVDLRSPPMAK